MTTVRQLLTARSLSRYIKRSVKHRSMSTDQGTNAPWRHQSIDAHPTRSAIFLVLTVKYAPEAGRTIRRTLTGLEGLVKTVAVRDPNANLACTVGIGFDAWCSLMHCDPPSKLRTLLPIAGAAHTAVSTPGDLLFHIRSERRDLCFELERQLLGKLEDAVAVEDETVGFRYFDGRDLLGFVDGTANPAGPEAVASAVVHPEDCCTKDDRWSAVGGSYILAQKYLHNLDRWNRLKTEAQEGIVGRTKLDNVELDDAEKGQQCSHKTLATVIGKDGTEQKILRDNMPFGSPASGEYGTYFIGYSRRPDVPMQMLERMFVGEPEGKHDRILDYSRPVTGGIFFAPAWEFLASIEE